MNLSRHSPAPTRYTGIALVVALHLAGIYALSAGLVRAPSQPHDPITLKPLPPEPPAPLPPQEPLKAQQPKLVPPQVINMPPPDIVVEPTREPALVTTVTTRTDNPVSVPQGVGRVDPQPTVAPTHQVTSAGAVCSVMPHPDVPVVSWSGEAVLNVVATVRGGRVVGTDVRVTQGALDSKTRHSLQRSVETALAGYQCQGDAVFQQDFAFRLD